MSKGPENTFIASVRRLLPKDLYVLKNNNQFNAGIPDLWISGQKGDLWVEVKFITIPKRDGTEISLDLSPLQQNWLKSRHAEGRSVGVLVGCKEGGVYFPGIKWDGIYTARDFRTWLRTRVEIVQCLNLICSLPSRL